MRHRVVFALGPIGSSRPVLTLPDGNRLFHRVDRETRGLEGLGTVRRRHHNGDRCLTHGKITETVQENDAIRCRPPGAQSLADSTQPGFGLIDVGLIREARDAGATLGIVPDDSEKRDDRTCSGRRGPRRRLL